MDSNPQGDEATSIPRKGSTGLVFFIDGEPFIFGFFRGMSSEQGAGAVGGNEYKGVEGDKVFSTIGGNRIVIKRSGLIEVKSKETLKRIYMPTDSQLIDICRNYKLMADGGFQKWTTTSPLNTTKYAAEYRMNMARFFVLYDEIGNVDATTVFRRTAGAAFPAVEGVSASVFKHEIKITGENTLQITPPGGIGGVNVSIKPTGAISIGTGLAPINQFALDVSPDGSTTVSVNKQGTVTIDKLGAIKAENKLGSIALSEVGDIDIKNKLSSISMSAAGKFKVQGAIAELLDLFDKTLEQQINTLIALQMLTVGTGTGPSSVPINLPDFTKAQAQLMQVKMLLASMKG